MTLGPSTASPAASLAALHARRARALRLAVLLGLALAAPFARASEPLMWLPDPAGTDALWSAGFGSPQFDGAVYAALRTGAGILVGGEFRIAGGVPARGIARWDGTHWSPLGDGLASPVTFLCARDDTVWAGWNVDDPDLGPHGWITRWDGHAWQAPFAAPSLASMLLHRGRLTIRGLGSAGLEVDQWDGAQWTRLGAEGSVATTFAGALFSDGDSLWASGRFPPENETAPAPVLKVWDGVEWSARAHVTDVSGAGSVLAIGSDAGALVIGGEFGEIDSVAAANVARRVGGVWEPMGSGLPWRVEQLTDDGAGGSLAFGPRIPGSFWGIWAGVFAWNGSAWMQRSLDLYPQPIGIVARGATVLPFGTFQQDGPSELHSLARLDATGARALPDPDAGAGGFGGITGVNAVDAIASFDGAVIAAGAISLPGDTIYWDGGRGVFRREGAGWRALTDGTYFSGRVLALLPFGDRLVAAGRFGMVLDGRPAGPVAAWDGTRWWPLGAFNDQVRSLAIYHGELYAGGDFTVADGLLCDHVARWTGTRWLPVGPPAVGSAPGAGVHALAVWRDRLIAGGSFTSMAGDTLSRIVAAWDGTHWTPLGITRSLAPVTAFAVTDTALYAGSEAPLHPITPPTEWTTLSMWDDVSWSHPRIPPDPGGVHALLATPQGLVVGADFVADDGSTLGLARFDGASWHPFGSSVTGAPGFDVSAHALALLPDGLWVGGAFTVAGGRSSARIARFEGLATAVPPPGSSALSIAPCPTGGPVTLRFRIAAPGRVVVRVFDIAGREVATAHDASHDAGPVVIAWDTGAADHGGLRSGVYLMRIESPGEAPRTARIAVVR